MSFDNENRSDADLGRLEQFKQDISDDADVTEDQREEANSDMRFINVIDGMWEDFLTDNYASDPGCERVKLQLDLVSGPRNRFVGEWNQNRVGVEYKPNDAGTTKDDSNLLNGIYRSDFRQFSGKLATDNAVDEVATCGVGAMKLATEFEDEEDPENENMNIVWRPIYSAYSTIYWDQAAQRIDKRDAKWCTELKQFTNASFKREYPGKNPVSAYTPEEFNYSSNNRTLVNEFIYIATRYEVVQNKVKMFVYNDLEAGKVVAYDKEQHEKIKDELAKNDLVEFVRERDVMRQSVEKTVFSGDAILEETRRIAGKWIPIVPFYGYRSFVDGVEWYYGLIRKLKDGQRLFNTQISQLAENAASTGQEVPIFAPEQMTNTDIQGFWSDKNNLPYLLAEPLKDKDGNIVATGPTGYNKPAQLDGSTSALVQIIPQLMQEITGGAPEEARSNDMSGKAINALIKRQNMVSQVLNDNIANAIAWSGDIYQAMAAEVYTSDRMVKTITKDGTDGTEQLLGLVMDEQTGMMIEGNDLRGKKFQSYADVGPQYDTIREQTVEELKGMMESLANTPEAQKYMPLMISVMINNISGVGLEPLKEFNRKQMIVQGLVKPENTEEEAMLQAAQQPKEDPQQKLVEAAAEQQQAEARSLDASSLQKTADASKKQAETAEILSGIERDDLQLFLDQKNTVREQAQKGLEDARTGLVQ